MQPVILHNRFKQLVILFLGFMHKPVIGPKTMIRGKYNAEGFARKEAMLDLGVHNKLAGPIAAAMNMGTSKATKDQYSTAIRHVDRVEKELGVNMHLPWDVTKTLNYVGFLLEVRKCSAKTVGCYLSGIRMWHLCNGFDQTCLRPDIVNLVLKGREHFEEAKKTLEGKPKRVAMTVPMMKLLLRKIRESEMSGELKTRVWLISCLMWNGSLRVSEVLSRTENEFDPLTTLCAGDVNCKTIANGVEDVEVLQYHIKSPKERRIGNGVKLEIFANGSFCCPVRAWKAWMRKVTLKEGQPVFMKTSIKCFTGKEFNRILTTLLSDLTEGTDGFVKSHSFRSGVATEMGRMGCSEEEIMAQGRWSSQAFKAYIKMGSLKRIQLAAKLRKIVCD